MKPTTVTQITDGLVRITEGQNNYLGVHVGNVGNSRAAKQFAERAQEAGWLIHDDVISNWKTDGFVEHDGEVYLYGPYFPARTFQEVLAHSPGSGISYVLSLVRVFALLKSRGLPLPVFQSNGILFLDDGGVLLLPPAVMERIRSKQNEAERLVTFERYNHPDLAGEPGLSFSIAVLLYRLTTAKYPFEADSEEELHERMRELAPIEPRYVQPEVRADVSGDIAASLDREGVRQLSLEQWVDRLDDWNRNGYTEALSEDRKDTLLQTGERLAQKAEKRYNVRQYFRRHWRGLAIGGAVVILVGSLLSSILSNVLAPPVTVGMDPRQVVNLFYTSITDLNHEAMQDCVTDGAGKAEITEATNLFVISRMRLGQEGTTGFIPAQKWKDSGEPKLDPQYHVYGVSDLHIDKVSETQFTVRYEKWEQATEATRYDVIPGTNSVAYARTDEVYLRKLERHNTWAIYQIDRNRDEILKADQIDTAIKG